MDVNNEFPFITCYARILDRITYNPITEFIDALDDTRVWDLGEIYYMGGYSQYVIEFDIWNNEPVVSNGFTQLKFDDAKNCNVSINSDNDYLLSPIVQIKNTIFNNKDQFLEISSLDNFDNLYGNVDCSRKGILDGKGDHMKFQVGIKLPEIEEINEQINFDTCFNYIGQNINIHLKFKCTFKILNDVYLPTINTIGEQSIPLTGKITCPSVYYPRGMNQVVVEAYTLNNILVDRCVTINDLHDVHNIDHPYRLFLTNGTYNINIKNNTHSRMNNGVNISSGIQQYYSYVEKGLIANINNDIIEYYVSNEETMTEIFGYIINEYDNPIKNAEIIISNGDDLLMYCVTNELGQYKFCLDYGNYDIRIRSNSRKVKIVNSFEFSELGLFNQIQNYFTDMNNKIIFVNRG